MTDARARIAKQITAALPLMEEGGDWYIDAPVFSQPRAINQIVNALIDAHIRIEQLEAAPAQGSAEPWQPMETVPKNGTEVILQVRMRAGIPGKMLVGHYQPGGHCIQDHPPIDAGWYFWNGAMFDKAAEPEKWMPLPAPPSVPQASPEPAICGKATKYDVIAGASWFACMLDPGHEGECQPGGNCFKHGKYVGATQCPKWPDCISQASAPEGEKR